MSSPENRPPDLSSHAPLIDRLRGKAFVPGVHYTEQAEVWMLEAAHRIEELQAEVAHLQSDKTALIQYAGSRDAEIRKLSAKVREWEDAFYAERRKNRGTRS